MRLILYGWLLCAFFVLTIPVMGDMPVYKTVFNDNHFMMESIFQVLDTGLNETNGIILTGKNYTAREVFIYWLTFSPEYKPQIRWQSDNLFEDNSVLWLANGKFTTDHNQLLAISSTKLYLYQFAEDTVNLVKQEKLNLISMKNGSNLILGISSGDLEGNGRTELVIARVGQISNKVYNGILQIYQFDEGKITLIAESGLLGNIRSIATGDIDEDGKCEIFVEEGLQFNSGTIHVIDLVDNKLKERYSIKKAVNGAVYAMAVKKFSDGTKLITGSTNGKIQFFSWSNNKLIPDKSEISIENQIVSLTAADINHGNSLKLLTVGYPQQFTIFTKNDESNIIDLPK